MMFRFKPTHTRGTPPWQEKELPAALKMASTFACGIMLVIAGLAIYVILSPPPNNATVTPYPQPVVMAGAVVVLLASLLILFKLLPYGLRQTRWTPQSGIVAADLLGQPYEIRFDRQIWSRSFFMRGTLRFDEAALILTGPQLAGVYVQLGVLLAVTLLPWLLFRVGIGLVPALALSAYVGRKQVSYTIPYVQVRNLMVKGCRVTFGCDGEAPPRVSFKVASVDGERLYRELAQRFPAALGGWVE